MAIVIDGSAGITDVDGSQVLSTADYDSISGVLDRDNRIINGDFGIWQRGTSFATPGYGADRWSNAFVGGTVTQSRQAFAIGDTLGVNSPTYFLRQTVSGQSLPTNNAITTQHIEGVRTYAGQTITVLGWARRSSGAGNMAINGGQWFGTGGATTPSTRVVTDVQIVTLTGSWEPFAVTINVPSITGKILSTLGNDYFDINIWTSAGANFAEASALGLQTIGVDLWGIHVKLGTHTASTAVQYRPRDPGTELELCQRYFLAATIGGGTSWALFRAVNFTASLNGTYGSYQFKVTMRRAPTVAYSWEINDVAQVGSMSSFGTDVNGLSFGHSVNAGAFIDLVIINADAEF